MIVGKEKAVYDKKKCFKEGQKGWKNIESWTNRKITLGHSSLKPVKLNLLETSKHRQRTTENCALKSENDALQYSQSPRIHNGYNIGYIPRDISYN